MSTVHHSISRIGNVARSSRIEPRVEAVKPLSIVGNCQASALGAVMRRSTLIDCRNIVDVNSKGSENYTRLLSSLHNDDDAYVLSQVMSDEFEELAWNNLKARFADRLIGYTNIFFSGLHPDLTYFGKRGLRVASPLGDYHSRIVLAAFVQGRSPDSCLAAFTGTTYERLGYFKHFVESAAELGRRDARNHVKFAKLFVELTSSTLTMLSVNHPTLVTIVELARKIEAFFSDKRSAMTPIACSYPLALGPIWPLYPEIREHNQLPYETAFMFYPHEGAGQALNLEDFIIASYASYEKQGRAVLAEVDADKSYENLVIC